jgi:site-specific DNA recombinase
VTEKQTGKGNEPAKGKSVGIWIRVSTADQAEGESPEHHLKRAEAYAEMKGWKVARVYDLSGVSGKTVKDHPEAQAMLKDIASGKITGLIFSKLARLARNVRECLDFFDHFEKHKAHLISIGEGFDTSTPSGRFVYNLMAALAQWEREEIADRVKQSVVVRSKMGKALGGAAPFGYKRVDSRLVPDEKEAPIRLQLYELFVQHKRLKTVAAVMNKAGYRTRNGSKFSDSTVYRLLCDPIAKGTRRQNYTRSTGDKKHWELKPQDEWITVPVEPIVPAELWDEVNALLEARRNGKRPAKRTVHLFTGLVWCDCAGKMFVPSESPKYTCPKCRRKIALTDLEAVFREQLAGFFLSPEDVRKSLEEGNQALVDKRALVEALVAEEAAVRADMDKTYRLYLDGHISSDGFGERYRPLEERHKQLTDELPRRQGEADFLAIQHLSSEEIVSEAQDLYGRWDTLMPEEKRGIVENIVERITVTKDSVLIDLYYSPDPPPTTRKKATQPHGFIATTRANRAGKATLIAARAMTTRPSSIG